jgi:WhiB family transcriptional regulator, redox-sensing transcriptional regulator
MSTFTVAAGPARDHSTGWRDWRADAACRDSDPELFFPDDDNRFARAHLKTAKLICRGCAVSASCLNWALASGQEAGIWGGLTEDERHRLRRLRSAPRDARHRKIQIRLLLGETSAPSTPIIAVYRPIALEKRHGASRREPA